MKGKLLPHNPPRGLLIIQVLRNVLTSAEPSIYSKSKAAMVVVQQPLNSEKEEKILCFHKSVSKKGLWRGD